MGKKTAQVLPAVFFGMAALLVGIHPAIVAAYAQPAEKTMPVSAEKGAGGENSSPDTEDDTEATYTFDTLTGCLTFNGPGGIHAEADNTQTDEKTGYAIAGEWRQKINGNKVRYILINNGVTFIDENVFACLPELEKVKISASVSRIGDCAFAGCGKLKNISIGNNTSEGQTEIGEAVFGGCIALQKITLGKNVTKLGERFAGTAPSLKTIALSDGNTHFQIKNKMLLNAEGTKVYLCPKKGINKITIPKGTETLMQLAFAKSTAKTVQIPASVKVIRAGAFHSCQNLKNITFSKNSKCKKADDTYEGTEADEAGHQIAAFSNCHRLKKVTFGNKLETISIYTFNGCKALKEIHFGKNFKGFTDTNNTSKKKTALSQYGLFSLQKISVAKANPKFRSINGILFTKSAKKLCLYPRRKSGESYMIPNSVVTVGNNAFEYNTQIQKIVFGNKVKTVGSRAFRRSYLTEATMNRNLTKIEAYAFAKCNRLVTVTWPAKVKNIGKKAFYDCWKLQNIHVAESSGLIVGNWAFCGCSNITDVQWPKSFKKIGNYAFQNCSSLSRAVLAGKKLNVSKYAFGNCTQLKEAIIQPGISSFGTGAFYNCTSLSRVTIPNSVKTIHNEAFGYRENSQSDSVRMKYFIIAGKRGSAAQEYAEENGIEFTEL